MAEDQIDGVVYLHTNADGTPYECWACAPCMFAGTMYRMHQHTSRGPKTCKCRICNEVSSARPPEQWYPPVVPTTIENILGTFCRFVKNRLKGCVERSKL